MGRRPLCQVVIVHIKVLIVDDSRIFRSLVEECLQDEMDVRVIGSVRNGIKAIEFIRKNRPDLITLDVEMPDMDGLETLNYIESINSETPELPPVGVLMISSFTRKGVDITIQALEKGAFDFITKPTGDDITKNRESLKRQLMVKIRHYATKRISSGFSNKNISRESETTHLPEKMRFPFPASQSRIRGIVIGVSTGGPRVLVEILPEICSHTDVPIFIVQHMPETFTESLAKSLNSRCISTVQEAVDNQMVQKGHVYLAPGGKHMVLRKQFSNVYTGINTQPPEKGCRPSVDVLFRSAAMVYGQDLIGIILTGMGKDGTKGSAAIKRAGGCVIAQDETTSVVWGMPGSAVAEGHVDLILPLSEIPETVLSWIDHKNQKTCSD